MVSRRFLLRHEDSTFDVDYDTEDGLEVFRFQIFSLTSVPPYEQKIVAEEGDRVVLGDSDLVSVSEKLRLVSVEVNCEENLEGNVDSCEKSNAEMVKLDEEFARMLQAEEEALLLQQYVAAQDSSEFERRIRPYVGQVLMYEDPARQEAARKTVPVEELEEKAIVALAKEGNFKPSKEEHDYTFLLQLLFWFKKTFRWVNEPPCDGCGSKTVGQGMGNPLPSELAYGANRVELYRCTFCSRITRFPRYNDPVKLLETRKGRCGEWANCFTLYCRSFGYATRLILDFTDHVWTECFSHSFGRWIHLDPCEGVYDKPLLYEKGWNKKLNYVIGIARDGVYDVTKRYTKKWHEILTRRTITTESSSQAVLRTLTRELRISFTPHVLSSLELRDSNEQEELERDLHSPDDASVSLPGRQSGDKGWRILRSEFGSDENSSVSSTSCPVRICVDDHVTKLYDSFSTILTQFVEDSLPTPRAIELLQIVKGTLVDLKSTSYKTRKARLNLGSDGSSSFPKQYLPSLDKLLHALSLKGKSDTDDKGLAIYLDGEPTKTSLALPVALDALEELSRDLGKCQNLNKESLSLPLVKRNRVCLGSVLASGEELPSGIASSAFDGIRDSKWEEPNGAKGCWIMYKTLDNKMEEVAEYELMSANDAPERDPKDWILEGSSDGGSTWRVLDEQTSQVFEARFQRNSYRIKPTTVFQANLFRFRFLAVRDVSSTSRLQLGSIDLYKS
ncbi:PREDICTED: peptide-N(4)-(N-acetyl-beta-glucosaminyl)asparagine amidase [Tarenaya hassleriana]|uniref:peptide-N(4)-(N-acetyl-beta- glucosaminyl)asparagine amidase n=1 Tax=Tarenaya hassleriana TaxID=28532 RepID=UPI00053C961D|nr:PREDICTED: peptide-N(4)-(N-acetyl-beta-glucosaminyl)asparagine amidase [Tarenaya hassleriana]